MGARVARIDQNAAILANWAKRWSILAMAMGRDGSIAERQGRRPDPESANTGSMLAILRELGGDSERWLLSAGVSPALVLVRPCARPLAIYARRRLDGAGARKTREVSRAGSSLPPWLPTTLVA
jgi:hypothetical protein